jgi:tetratricopeptide (TPR) repeat protein
MMRISKMIFILACAAAAILRTGVPCHAADYPSIGWVYRAKPDISPKSIVFPDDATVVFQTQRNVVHGVDAETGARRWAYAIEDQALLLPVPAAASGLERSLVIAATPKIVHALDIEGRRRPWSTPVCGTLPRGMGALANGGVLQVQCGNGKPAYLKLADGAAAASAALKKAPIVTPPPPADIFQPALLGPDTELVFKGSSAILMRRGQNEPAWEWKAPDPLAHTAALFNNRLYLLTVKGILTGLDPETGKKTLSLDLTRHIDMRFWDELPQNVDNYAASALFARSGRLFVRGPSFIARIKILPFPEEITLSTGDTPQARALQLAIMSWDSRSFQAALGSFHGVVEQFPDYAPAHMFLGMGYSALREQEPRYLDLAIHHLEKALELDPHNPDISSNLLGNYLIKAMSLNTQTQKEAITALYHKAQRISPFSLIAYVGLAEVYLGEKDFAAAAATIATSLEYGFMGRDQYLLLLASLYMAGDTDAALDIAARSAQYFPDSRTAFVLKGKLHCKRGQYAEAIKAFEAAPAPDADIEAGLSTFPRLLTAGAGFFHGNALGLSGRYADGVARLHEFVNNLPSEWQLKQLQEEFEAGLDAVTGGANEVSITVGEKFRGRSLLELRADRDFQAPALLSIAHFEFRQGNTRESLKYIAKVEALKPEDHETLSYVGYFYALNGKELNKALKLTRAAWESSPDDVVYLKNYAVALWKNGRANEAEQYFLKAMEKNQPTEFLHYEYALVLLDIPGRRNDALAQIKKEYALSPQIEVVRDAMKKLKLIN